MVLSVLTLPGPNLPAPSRPDRRPFPLSPEERAKLLDRLSRDPSNGGRVDVKSLREGQIGLELYDRGDLHRPDRDPSGGAEFCDDHGQYWDIKRLESGHPPPHNFSDQVTNLLSLTSKAFRDREYVIIDTENATPADVIRLRREIEQRGWGDWVSWYP